MSILSQIRNGGDRRRHNVDRWATVENLLAGLRGAETALRVSIEAEEQRTRVHDQNDPCYPILARSMRSRADKIRATIATLERLRVVSEAPPLSP